MFEFLHLFLNIRDFCAYKNEERYTTLRFSSQTHAISIVRPKLSTYTMRSVCIKRSGNRHTIRNSSSLLIFVHNFRMAAVKFLFLFALLLFILAIVGHVS